MGSGSSPNVPPVDEHRVVELHLRIGNDLFGVAFLDLADARKAARAINKTGRSVEIFEKLTGHIVDRMPGGLPRRAAELNTIQARLMQKAHKFQPGAIICARCGLTLLESLSMPMQCGEFAVRPGTLTQAIDAAEHP
jgi:hypothetical protein